MHFIDFFYVQKLRENIELHVNYRYSRRSVAAVPGCWYKQYYVEFVNHAVCESHQVKLLLLLLIWLNNCVNFDWLRAGRSGIESQWGRDFQSV